MIKKIALFIVLIAFQLNVATAQQADKQLPSVDIKTLEGMVFNTGDIANEGQPILISFWATWCKPCVKELDAINDLYIDWQDAYGLKIFAVSTDDSRSSSRVAPFANGRGWEYDILLDPNADFKRAMNVVNIPHSFLIDGEGNIVWQHTGYSDGDEYELEETIEALVNGELETEDEE